MTSTASLLQILATATFLFGAQSSASSPTVESNFQRLEHAAKRLAHDFGPMRDLYAPNADLKFCWEGHKPDCVEGTVDDVLKPLHDVLKIFTVKMHVTGPASPDLMNVRWLNYVETKFGCGEEVAGTATYEFDADGKVISHHAVFDNAPHCVPEAIKSANSNSAAASRTDIETRFDRFNAAYQVLDSDFDPMREIYAPDAYFKFCWGGDEPNCAEGSIDEMLRPFHECLKTFKVKTEVITGEHSEVMSLRWNNYMETKLGCGEVTTGIALVEYNEDGKVSRHYSLSDNSLHCVPEYERYMADTVATN